MPPQVWLRNWLRQARFRKRQYCLGLALYWCRNTSSQYMGLTIRVRRYTAFHARLSFPWRLLLPSSAFPPLWHFHRGGMCRPHSLRSPRAPPKIRYCHLPNAWQCRGNHTLFWASDNRPRASSIHFQNQNHCKSRFFAYPHRLRRNRHCQELRFLPSVLFLTSLHWWRSPYHSCFVSMPWHSNW